MTSVTYVIEVDITSMICNADFNYTGVGSPSNYHNTNKHLSDVIAQGLIGVAIPMHRCLRAFSNVGQMSILHQQPEMAWGIIAGK